MNLSNKLMKPKIKLYTFIMSHVKIFHIKPKNVRKHVFI